MSHSRNISILKLTFLSAFAEEEKLTEAEWESVFVLAARWKMDHFHHLAFKKLGPSFSSDPYKLVIMSREHNADWLVSDILLLVLRKDPMGDEDVNNIGVSAVLKVSMIREWIFQWKISHRDSTEWIFKPSHPTEKLLLRFGRHSVLMENNRQIFLSCCYHFRFGSLPTGNILVHADVDTGFETSGVLVSEGLVSCVSAYRVQPWPDLSARPRPPRTT